MYIQLLEYRHHVFNLRIPQELRLGHRADKSLSNFCYWQSTTNTSTGRRPDHSILLTGIDICIDQNRPCDTLGMYLLTFNLKFSFDVTFEVDFARYFTMF